MGISRLNAMIISSRDVICEAGGPSKEEGKYVGWIMLDVDRWHPLLSTEPIYNTKEEAKKVMEDIVAAIREKIDPEKELDKALSPLSEDEKQAVKTIVNESQKET